MNRSWKGRIPKVGRKRPLPGNVEVARQMRALKSDVVKHLATAVLDFKLVTSDPGTVAT